MESSIRSGLIRRFDGTLSAGALTSLQINVNTSAQWKPKSCREKLYSYRTNTRLLFRSLIWECKRVGYTGRGRLEIDADENPGDQMNRFLDFA